MKIVSETLKSGEIMSVKSVLYSKTVWSTLGLMFVSVFGILAPDMFLPESQKSVEYGSVAGVVAMAALIIYFRMRATGGLVLTRHEKYGMFLLLLPSILTVALFKTTPWMHP